MTWLSSTWHEAVMEQEIDTMRKLRKYELKRVYGAGHSEDTSGTGAGRFAECDSDAHLGGSLDSDKHREGGDAPCTPNDS